MGPRAPAVFIFKRRTEQIAKMPCFGTAPCTCDRVIYFFSLFEGRIEKFLLKSSSPVFLTPFLSFCSLSLLLPSAQSTKKAYPLESARAPLAERAGRHHLLGGSNGHPRATPRAHPFTQDPAMPPLTPPNTLAQLEEACRRLAEVSKPPKQR